MVAMALYLCHAIGSMTWGVKSSLQLVTKTPIRAFAIGFILGASSASCAHSKAIKHSRDFEQADHSQWERYSCVINPLLSWPEPTISISTTKSDNSVPWDEPKEPGLTRELGSVFTQEDKAAGTQLFRVAIEKEREGDFNGAIGLYKRAYMLIPIPRLLCYLGQAQAEANDKAMAYANLSRCLFAGYEPKRGESFLELKQNLILQTAALKVVSSRDGLIVSIDGVERAKTPMSRFVRVNTPQLSLEISAPGFKYTKRIDTRGDYETTVTVTWPEKTEAVAPYQGSAN